MGGRGNGAGSLKLSVSTRGGFLYHADRSRESVESRPRILDEFAIDNESYISVISALIVEKASRRCETGYVASVHAAA